MKGVAANRGGRERDKVRLGCVACWRGLGGDRGRLGDGMGRGRDGARGGSAGRGGSGIEKGLEVRGGGSECGAGGRRRREGAGRASGRLCR